MVYGISIIECREGDWSMLRLYMDEAASRTLLTGSVGLRLSFLLILPDTCLSELVDMTMKLFKLKDPEGWFQGLLLSSNETSSDGRIGAADARSWLEMLMLYR